MEQKIRCKECNKIIAEGNLPATVKIKCPHCKTINDLNVDKTRPFAQRLPIEKK